MRRPIFLIFPLFLISMMCAPKLVKPTMKPEEIPDFAFKNLKRQRSFAFDYRLEQKEPVSVKHQASGIYILPDQVEIQGSWIYGDGSTLPFKLVGYGDKEYEKTDTGWTVHSRGEETDLLVQVERAKALGKFKLTKERPNWEFEFSPNVPFLDPTLSKKITGLLVIDRNYLPKSIAAWTEAKTAFWQVEFRDFNKPQRINLPFVKQMRVTLTGGEKRQTVEKIRQRFLTVNLEATVSVKGGQIELVLAQEVKEEFLKNLLAPGVLQVAKVRWLDRDSGSGDMVFDGRPVAVETPLLTNSDFTGARVNFDPLGRLVLELLLNPEAEKKFIEWTKSNQGLHYAIVIDGKILAINYIDKIQASGIIPLTEFSSFRDALMTEAIINSGPLAEEVKIIALKKE